VVQDLAGSLIKHPLWQFSRPHTILGTSISLVGILGVSLSYGAPVSVPIVFWTAAIALVSCLLANVYIVGLNQITDVEIDRINKPYLPLANNTLTPQQAQYIVIFCLVTSLLISFVQSKFLFATVLVSTIIGTAYSLPPFRLKRFPIWASLCIFAVRGFAVHLGLYAYLVDSLKIVDPAWERLFILMAFMLIFSVVIALFKDIPDTLGDAQNNIQTFSLQFGRTQIFQFCIALLVCDYLGVVLLGVLGVGLGESLAGRGVLAFSHLCLLLLLLWEVRKVKGDPVAFTYFYQFVWKLFYLEYILFPAACLLTR